MSLRHRLVVPSHSKGGEEMLRKMLSVRLVLLLAAVAALAVFVGDSPWGPA